LVIAVWQTKIFALVFIASNKRCVTDVYYEFILAHVMYATLYMYLILVNYIDILNIKFLLQTWRLFKNYIR